MTDPAFEITVLGEKEAAKMLGAITKKAKERIRKALKRCGLKVEGDAKRICPVRTGRLRASITTSEVVDYSVTVGTNVSYAPFVELGTSRQKEKPYLRPALYNNQKFCRDYMLSAINQAISEETLKAERFGMSLFNLGGLR